MTTSWVDFKAIKSAVTIEQVLNHYKINWLRKSGEELRGRCPIHNGEGENTFHANPSKNVFHCFSCKARGNTLDFVAAMEKCTVREAAQKLQEWFLVAPTDTSVALLPATNAGESRGEQPTKNEPLKFQLKGVDHAHPYLASRGIGKKVAEEFGVGFFSGKGSMNGRIVIPIHDEDGVLVAYAGRSIDDSEPKYKLPSGFKKSQVVYNLHRAVQAGVDAVVIVEGYFGCMKVTQAGFACVALMGSEPSELQAQLLCQHFSAFILLFDPDEAGQNCTDQCLETLGRQGWVRAITLQTQPDKMGEDEIVAALSESDPC